jgi:hypothetical protein
MQLLFALGLIVPPRQGPRRITGATSRMDRIEDFGDAVTVDVFPAREDGRNPEVRAVIVPIRKRGSRSCDVSITTFVFSKVTMGLGYPLELANAYTA